MLKRLAMSALLLACLFAERAHAVDPLEDCGARRMHEEPGLKSISEKCL